ncbi:MAG TPA: hypothetical protein VND89_01545 [Acidimicrobiales bacterium]|nr:hypothetical protein [Acidimicrobiales bacterium]
MKLRIEDFPTFARPFLKLFHVDFAPLRQPPWGLVGLATVVSLVGSLVADALLVAIGTRVFPSTKGYGHFHFSDYSKLTIIGVLIACVGWSIVTRITSTPRWLFLRAALAVSVVLLLPDAFIWYQGASIQAVFVLVWMHFAIALVTYNALVRLAPISHARHAR